MCDVDDGRATWYIEDRRRARKPHWCEACGERIEPRHEYVRIVYSSSSDFAVVLQCLRCHALFRALQRANPREAIAFALDCGEYIEDEDHPLQWLAFALPTDAAVAA
jgi:hypothetical protein